MFGSLLALHFFSPIEVGTFVKVNAQATWLLMWLGASLKGSDPFNCSSTPAFLAAVSPTVALFPVGYRNRYGFPKAQIVQRYIDQQVRVFDMIRHGAIELQLGGEAGLDAVITHRQQAARYWHVK